MGKPLKKKKAPTKINDRVPTKGNVECGGHRDGKGCFRVNLRMNNTDHHWPDEGGAVLFAMRHSREQETHATVYDPEGRVIVQFTPREYDWREYMHAYTAFNEDLQSHIFSAQIRQKAKPREPIKQVSAKKPLRRKAK